MKTLGRGALLAVVVVSLTATLASSQSTNASFELVPDVKVSNPWGPQLNIDAQAGTAVWDHCCDGGKWRVRVTWHVPQEMSVGQSYPIELGITIDSYQSGGPSGFQMNTLAPDLAEALNVQAPTPGRGTRTVTFLARDYLKDWKEFSITIGFLSGGVTYTYRR